MDESTVIWEEPPAQIVKRGGPTGIWHKRLAPLMEQPGRWARISEKSSKTAASAEANNLRKPVVRRPPGRWEFVSRTNGSKSYVYGRYLGPEE